MILNVNQTDFESKSSSLYTNSSTTTTTNSSTNNINNNSNTNTSTPSACSFNLVKNININNKNTNSNVSTVNLQQENSSSNQPASATSTNIKNLKILKSYYKKDALESVNRSIDEPFNLNNIISTSSLSSSSALNSSTSSTSSISNKNVNRTPTTTTTTTTPISAGQIVLATNSEYHNSQQIKQDKNPAHIITSSSSASCIQFVNNLVDSKIRELSKQQQQQALDLTDNRMSYSSKQTSSTAPNLQYITKDTQQNYYTYAAPSVPPLSNTLQKRKLSLLSKNIRAKLPFNMGLKNHGNTCFMNCVLQCLFHTSPLCDFFISNRFQDDIYERVRQYKSLMIHNQSIQAPSFILTEHFYRLIYSLWYNKYDTNLSADMKHVIGSLNTTFAGVNQNDSHEFCVWLLDRLDQELTYKNPTNSNNNNQFKNVSFIQELFKVEFKSTVICSKCNYKSNKYEEDMMLSLSLPHFETTQSNRDSNRSNVQTKTYKRRSLYANLMLINQNSIKNICIGSPVSSQNNPTSSSSYSSISSLSTLSTPNDYYTNTYLANDYEYPYSKSRFYIDPVTNNSEQVNIPVDPVYIAPVHVKIGVNIHVSTDPSNSQRELVNIGDSSNPGGSSTSTVVNPDVSDLRRYIESAYSTLKQSNLVFIDLNRIEMILNDKQSIKDLIHMNTLYLQQQSVSSSSSSSSPSASSSGSSSFYSQTAGNDSNLNMCIVELNDSDKSQQQQSVPLINIIGINVFYEPVSSSSSSSISSLAYQQQQQFTNNNNTNGTDYTSKKRFMRYGLPFVVQINRDCSYSDLCKKLLEAQSKHFKDKHLLKYKNLVEKFFTLSVVNSNSKHQTQRLNSSDELPLYAESVDKALSDSVNISSNVNIVEHIRLNIEWKSYEDIKNVFKDVDYSKAEYIHKTVKYLQKYDEADSASASNSNNESPTNTSSNPNQPNSTTLNDCFEIFTQCEELTHENSWMCPKCKKQTNAYKKLCISNLPPILIIHLKRFFYKSKTSNFKLTTPVWFPISNLDMSKYIERSNRRGENEGDDNEDLPPSRYDIDDPVTGQQYTYDLFAVCNHNGQNMANGHYTAYCKNVIDTRWYCFDDSNCKPLFDDRDLNVFNNGSSNVCTENAYILFYKKRDCMVNETWWKNHIDKSLNDYDEFDIFIRNLEFIEKYQNNKSQQEPQQIQQNGAAVQPKKSNNSFKVIRKILGNSKSSSNTSTSNTINYENDDYGTSNIDYYYNSNGTAMTERDTNEEASYDYPTRSSDFYVCQREINRQAERQHQEEILRMNNSGRGYEVVNHYDETIRPKRLLKQSNSKEFSTNINQPVNTQVRNATLSTSSSVTNNLISPSTSSSSAVSSASPSTSVSSNSFNQTNLKPNDLIDLNEFNNRLLLNGSENNNLLLNYPSDNEYIYSSNPNPNYYHQMMNQYHQQQQQQQQQQQAMRSAYQVTYTHPNTVLYQIQKGGGNIQQNKIPNNSPTYTNRTNIATSNLTNPANTSNTQKYMNPASIETHI